MQFEKIPVAYLQKLSGQLRTQEQTLEVRLPDGMPDIGHVLGAWGQVVVRGKEWNGDHMAVSCGVLVWVLYTPEDEEGVHSVEAWLPFAMKWDLPESRYDGKIMVSCLLKNVDARSTSARKLLVRASVDAMAEAWQPTQGEIAAINELPKDIQLLTATYPVMLPKETGEKAFLLEEQIDLPSSGPKAEKLMYYSLLPEITDQKVMAGKVVFRGNAALHILYKTTDGRLCTYDYDLPFSQYADLDGAYDQEPDLWVQPCITSLDVLLDDDGTLQVKAGILGQYLLWDRVLVTVAEDAYSPIRSVAPIYQQLVLPAVLDRTAQTVYPEAVAQTDAQQIVDLTFMPQYGQWERSESGVQMPLPGQFQMLYHDPEGELHCAVTPWQGMWDMETAPDSAVDPRINPVGRPVAMAGAGNVNQRGELRLESIITAGQGIPMVVGLELGEIEKPDPNRPGLILCRKGNKRLWDVAKQNGTTVEQIMFANQLTEEPNDDMVLLIPVS